MVGPRLYTLEEQQRLAARVVELEDRLQVEELERADFETSQAALLAEKSGLETALEQALDREEELKAHVRELQRRYVRTDNA